MSNITNEESVRQSVQEQEINLLELAKKLWNCRKLILIACAIGAIVGIVIGSGVPKEYTASVFIVPENSRRSSSSGISELSDMAGIDMKSSSTTERMPFSHFYIPTSSSLRHFLCGFSMSRSVSRKIVLQ